MGKDDFSKISRFDSSADHYEKKGNREWAYASNGLGNEHYGKAKDAYRRAADNRNKARNLWQDDELIDDDSIWD